MMTDKLTRLEENLRTLKNVKDNYTLENLLTDKVDEWGLRYGIFESIQIIIDICCHIVAEKNLGAPQNYSECISCLTENKFLNLDLGNKLIGMIGLRNLIVHEYGIVDIKRVFGYLDHLEDISDFIYAVRDI
jgi:uncharacterized protein YutE (UPF0331/DUF86 family)